MVKCEANVKMRFPALVLHPVEMRQKEMKFIAPEQTHEFAIFVQIFLTSHFL